MKLFLAAAAAAFLLFTGVPGQAHPSRAEPPPVPPAPAAGAPPVVSPPATGAPLIVPPPAAGAPHTETGAVDGAYPAMPFDPVKSRTAADLQAFWNAMMRVKAGQNAAMASQAALAAQREEQATAAIDLLAARIRRNDLQGAAASAARRLYTDEPARTPLLESLGVDDEAERATADAERAAAKVGNLEVRLAVASRAVLGTAARLATERRQLAKDEAALTVLRRWADQYAAQARRWRAAPAPNLGRPPSGGARPPSAGVRPRSAGIRPPSVYPGGRLLRPVRGVLTSRFGGRFDPYYKVYQLHAGADFAVPAGTRIRAAAAGRVTRAGTFGGYGNFTCIEHGRFRQERLTTCYAHQSEILVDVGQSVAAGETIGLVGSTGASTGPHLHFEVRLGGRPMDPLPWL